ncbi:MAG: PUR family DNA/RNA-binding protein [Bacteroidota bacterium]|nr:PUR family DNA/RNA-binding protein [Bacteroidota bacterium]
MAYENNDKKMESIYSKRIRAGKRRTYFFDVRATRGNDYYLTITESRKRFNDNGYDRHKIFLYKEDFNKFLKALTEAVDHVKTQLMPDFDFDAFNHDEVADTDHEDVVSADLTSSSSSNPSSQEEEDKW